MSLSKENREKLDPNILYRKEPDENIEDPYWCRNWTFHCPNPKAEDVYMYDTYFDDPESAILVTDQNIDEFEIVFDFRKVKRIRPSEVSQYGEEEVIHVATDSFSIGYDYVKIDQCAEDIDTSIIKRAIAYLKMAEGSLTEKEEGRQLPEEYYIIKGLVKYIENNL
jgi:hypothetical protein